MSYAGSHTSNILIRFNEINPFLKQHSWIEQFVQTTLNTSV